MPHHQHSNSTQQKSVFTALSKLGTAVLVIVQVAVLFLPQIALAQVPQVVTDPGLTGAVIGIETSRSAQAAALQSADISAEAALQVQREVKLETSQAFLAGALGGLLHTATYFANRIAYDTAVWVAAGGKGQSALIFKDGFNEYLKRVGGDALASGIDEFGQDFLGIGLCQIPDIDLQVYLKLGINALYPDLYGAGGPQPNCTFQELREGWSNEAISQRFGADAQRRLGRTFTNALQVDNTDFGVALGFIGRVDRQVADARIANILDRLEGDGLRGVSGLIDNRIQTPAALVEQNLQSLSSAKQSSDINTQIAGIYGAGLYQVIPAATQIFANTLATQLLQRAVNGLFRESTPGSGGQAIADFYQTGSQSALEVAQNNFGGLFTASPIQIPTYNIVSEFASCPGGGRSGINNCVIDPGFQRALIEASTVAPLTIKDAVERGWLFADWPLISPRRATDNASEDCHLTGYCFSNIQKLRKVGVLPIGFEIAVLNSDPDNPWTLGEVLEGFDECDYDENGVYQGYNENYPFCRLINPNWVLKVPAARCEIQTYLSSQIDERSPNRAEGCIDISTCVATDSNGNCLSYGYCTKTENAWALTGPAAGDACPAAFATCESYTNGLTGQTVSYLSRTVDYDECTEDSVGCRPYATEQIDGQWVSTAAAQNFGLAYTRVGRNPMMAFNQRAIEQQSCPEGAEGCRALYGAVETIDGFQKNTNDLAYLQVAPAYLGCYDTNRRADSPETNWPTTLVEIETGLSGNEACADFATVCLEEETSCELYEPIAGGPTVPGVIGANSCPTQCVGYETFKQVGFEEQGQGFESEVYPLHFIPSAGEQCSAAYVGCDEFTNIDTLAQGGESLEYFTDIKYCEKPTGSNTKTFYSWEGTVEEGFSLRTHELNFVDEEQATYLASLGLTEQNGDGIDAASVFPVGSPAYANDSKLSLEEQYTRCNERNYQNLINGANGDVADPDCRAFYDDEANVYYRLLAETVTVSDQCTYYRKSNADFVTDLAITTQGLCEQKQGFWTDVPNDDVDGPVCERCAGGGRFENGSCVYSAIAAESGICPEAANGCREYRGNVGNDVYFVFGQLGDTFEPTSGDPNALRAAAANWSPENGVQVTAESTQVGLNSLAVNTNEVRRSIPVDAGLEQNTWYELTFWAKGTPQNLVVAFEQAGAQQGSFSQDIITGQAIQTSIGSTWREYRLGPVQFTGDVDQEANLLFRRIQSGIVPAGVYYIDNVILKEIQGNQFLIKDSWQTAEGYDVPLLCDSNPDDAFPGAMLGCEAYRYDNGTQVATAVGFDSLCRAEAVGCRAFYDTQNTLTTEGATAYNVWCQNADENGLCEIAGGRCQIEQGQQGCFVDRVEIGSYDELPSYAIKPETIYIPADTPEDDPIFLVDRAEFRCEESELGCMELGQEQQTIRVGEEPQFEYASVYIKNNPDLYAGSNSILCRSDLVGCSEFQSAEGTEYFKDPTILGNATCSYRPAGQGDQSNNQYGWYMDGVGSCSQDANQLCTTDAACGEGNTCQQVGSLPCYDNYLAQGGEFGIWSNESAQYEGFVGQCTPAFSGCTELVDRNDTSPTSPNGTPYYVVFNEKIEQRMDACQGQASLEEGCIVFDRTDEPNKQYDTALTYQKSAEQTQDRYGLVTPVSTDANDANVIIKVNRDRSCSEWLACKSYATVSDPATGQQTQVCHEYRACAKADASGCIEWVDTSVAEESNELLTEAFYVNRSIDWNAEEYTGYSLLNKYPVSDYQSLSFFEEANQTPEVQYLAYQADEAEIDEESLRCFVNGTSKPDYSVCGNDAGGRCIDGACYYRVSGQFSDQIDEESSFEARVESSFVAASCKEFPAQDAPFPNSVVPKDEQVDYVTSSELKRTEFPSSEQRYICQNGACSCEYDRVQYKTGDVDFWSINQYETAVPTGVCSDSSPKPGYPCGADYECAENGALGQYEETGYCQPIQSKQKFIGTKGFCLEYDYSRPIADGAYECLTWYPSKLSASNIDTNNAFISAGYNPAVDASRGFGQVYCAEATQFGRGEFQTEWYNSDITDGLIANETAVEEIYYRNFQSNGFPQPFQCEEFSDDDLNLGSDAFKDFARIYLGLPEGTEFSFGADSPQYNEIVDAYRTEYCYSVYETARGDDGYFCQNVQTNGRYRNQFTRLYSEYAGVICRGFTDAGNDLRGGPETPTDINVSDKFKDQYALLQTWAWSRLGNSGATANQVVLRMDGFAIRGNGDSRSDADGYNSGSKIRTDGTSSMTYYPLSFAPDRFLNPANDRDAGTIMHPPRHWREQSETISSDDAFTLRYLPRSDKQVFVNPLMWAPGNELEPNISFSDHNNRILETEAKDAVYRSEYESSLNETMLDRVYFVPLAYLDGINGAIPMQMNERMYIDFTSLRNNDSRVEQRSVPLALSTGGSDKVGNFNPKPNVNTPNGIVTTYLLDRNKDDFSQIAYTDYRFSGETEFAVRSRRDPLTEEIIEQQLVDDGRDPRNEIHKRYVMIFSGPSETTGYASVYGVPSGRFDPFTRECNSELGNMLAIGMDFNKDGEFLGYISRWCHGAPNDSTGMKMAVVAQVFDQCTEFAQVYDNRVNPIYGTTNKAWTNRVWAGAQTDHPYAEGFFPGQEIRPFGSLGVTSEQLQSISPVLRSQGFSSAINGLPLSCRSNYLYEGFFGSSVRRCNSLINAGVDPGVLASIAGNETGVILDNLFAMTHMRVRYDLRENSFVYGQQIGPNGGATDVSGSVSSGPEEPALYVPQVYGLNSETCFGEDGTTVRCTAGPADTISVGRYTGTVVDLNQDGVIDGDRNRDGRPDDIVAVGAYNATTRFFAWADEDRMPIRQVKIDWTDGSNILNEDRRGLYKNQKPFCADSGQVGSCYDTQGTFVENGVRYIRKTKILPGLTCQTSSDCSVEGYLDQGNPDERYICEPSQASQTSFGNATRACEEGYFEFNHAYSCGPREFADPNVEKAIISVLPAATRDQFLAFGYEPTDSVCAFKPKVQIIDNWGYCNGTCESGDCYNDGARAMCDNPNSGDNPWTSFGGMIYVAPSAQYDIEQAQFEDLFLLPPQDAAAINVNP